MKNRLNILEVSNLTKIYKLKSDKFGGNYSLPLKYSSNKQITAIDDISFQLRHGECLGVIGKNGAGKSTLLKVLSGIVSPSSGMVQYQGRLLSILDIGTGFHPDLTGRQNIFMNGQILGISKKEISNKVESIIEYSGVSKFIDEPIKHYSSGMYLRLAFSIVIHLDADLLILDEIISVGDISFQKKCMEHINNLKSIHKISLVLASHNLRQIAELCDRVLLIEEGKIIKDDQSYDIIKKYTMDEKKIPKIESKTANINNVKGDINNMSPIEIKDIVIKDNKGDIISKTNRSNEIIVEVRITLLTDNKGYNLGFAISDIYNNRLFGDGTMSLNEFSSLRKGDYLIRFIIPGKIFNWGLFNVNIFVLSKNKTVVIKMMGLAKFEIIENQKEKDKIGYIPMKFDIQKTILIP